MIILDLSQVSIAAITVTMDKTDDVTESFIRHVVLNTIRANYMKYKNKYGELIIACDGRKYWRKQRFPHYKANRKKSRDASPLDWQMIFDTINTIKAEIREHFPFRIIEVESAEADDIIATICHRYGTTLGSGDEEILILSGDKDFVQLQKYSNVNQYDPVNKRSIVENNPHAFLINHIIRGDFGDGIPNILSDDTVLVDGIRSQSLTKKRLTAINEAIESGELGEYARNYHRNKELIDLDCIPSDIQTSILGELDVQKDEENRGLFEYLMKHRLKNLMENIGDFS